MMSKDKIYTTLAKAMSGQIKKDNSEFRRQLFQVYLADRRMAKGLYSVVENYNLRFIGALICGMIGIITFLRFPNDMLADEIACYGLLNERDSLLAYFKKNKSVSRNWL